MTSLARKPHLWTRSEYEAMIDAGGFRSDARLELLDGEIFDMAPQNSPHSTGIQLLIEALRKIFGAGYVVRSQLPLALDDFSEPEPDIAVVNGTPRDYRDAHPSTALLVVEVADSSLDFDRTRKRSAYARAGIPEYWILNVKAVQLEVFREPINGEYQQSQSLQAQDLIFPLAAPDQTLRVSDVLP